MQIEHAVLDDPAYRVAPIVWSPDVVTFFSNEYVIASRIHLAGLIRAQKISVRLRPAIGCIPVSCQSKPASSTKVGAKSMKLT